MTASSARAEAHLASTTKGTAFRKYLPSAPPSSLKEQRRLKHFSPLFWGAKLTKAAVVCLTSARKGTDFREALLQPQGAFSSFLRALTTAAIVSLAFARKGTPSCEESSNICWTICARFCVEETQEELSTEDIASQRVSPHLPNSVFSTLQVRNAR